MLAVYLAGCLLTLGMMNGLAFSVKEKAPWWVFLQAVSLSWYGAGGIIAILLTEEPSEKEPLDAPV